MQKQLEGNYGGVNVPLKPGKTLGNEKLSKISRKPINFQRLQETHFFPYERSQIVQKTFPLTPCLGQKP